MDTISDEYLNLNKQLHESRLDYGVSGAKRAGDVAALRRKLRPDAVLDYGCGKGTLGKALSFPIREYDPAIPGKDSPPLPVDLVICSDVMEHVEPECLEAVIRDLRRVTKKLLYVVIHTGPAVKLLADGRNAHLIQKPVEWWMEKLSEAFYVMPVPNMPDSGIEAHLYCIPVFRKDIPALRRALLAGSSWPARWRQRLARARNLLINIKSA